jgi:flagellar protein FlaG
MEIGYINMTQPAPATVQPTSFEGQTENREMIKAVKALNQTELFGQNNELTFVLDRETHRPLVRIIDRETKEIIRQIPPEYALRLADDLNLLR